jgi:hypothetical protein
MDKTDCSTGLRETFIFKVRPNAQEELEKIDAWENSKVLFA